MQLSRRFTDQATDLFSEFDRLFRHSVGRGGGLGELPRGFSLYENEQGWILRADLPGFRKEDLELEVRDGVLSLSGASKDEDFPVEFRQSLRLPKGVRVEAISARLEHGVLELTLPKAEPDTPETLRIEVN